MKRSLTSRLAHSLANRLKPSLTHSSPTKAPHIPYETLVEKAISEAQANTPGNLFSVNDGSVSIHDDSSHQNPTPDPIQKQPTPKSKKPHHKRTKSPTSSAKSKKRTSPIPNTSKHSPKSKSHPSKSTALIPIVQNDDGSFSDLDGNQLSSESSSILSDI